MLFGRMKIQIRIHYSVLQIGICSLKFRIRNNGKDIPDSPGDSNPYRTFMVPYVKKITPLLRYRRKELVK
jgi:hypothetical protein